MKSNLYKSLRIIGIIFILFEALLTESEIEMVGNTEATYFKGAHIFQECRKSSSNSRREKADVKHVPY